MTDIQHLGLATPVPSKQARRAQGRQLRQSLPRGSHAGWTPADDRPDPVALVARANGDRLPELVAIHLERLVDSAFSFLRGNVLGMAADLAPTPASGLHVWLCGDAHLTNFGLYASPERELVFDLDDFDEAIAGPWEWDLKRFITSLVVAGRDRGLSTGEQQAAAMAASAQYRHAMRRSGDRSLVELFTHRLDDRSFDRGVLSKAFNAELHRSRRKPTVRTADPDLPKLTVGEQDGEWRFEAQPPLLVRATDAERAEILAALEDYTLGLLADRRDLIRSYHLVDAAHKAEGLAGIGRRSWVAALQGGTPEDTLFLQLQQAGHAAHADFLPPQHYTHQGQRIVDGQRRLQSVADPFLGWTSFGGHDYYVRQLGDMRGSVDPTRLDAAQLLEYGRVCADLLARAHARTGDPVAIAGYCGNSDSLDRALTDFALAYADQNERDWQTVRRAVRDGRFDTPSG